MSNVESALIAEGGLGGLLFRLSTLEGLSMGR